MTEAKQQNSSSSSSSSSVKIISFANANHVGLLNFSRSIEKCNGWNHLIIGQDTKWEGWMTRMKAYQETCAKLPPDEVIVLADAYDVLCIRSGGQAFRDKFFTLQSNIVIGAETGCSFNCFPPVQYYKYHHIQEGYSSFDDDAENKRHTNASSEKRIYCNGGLIAGLAGSLTKMWQWCIDRKFDDDQIAIGHFVDNHPSECHLDMESVLFFNDHLAETKYRFLTNTHQLILNNQMYEPFFIHFHGLNIDRSVPFFNLFQTSKMFQVGKNYVTVGKHMNGEEHITAFPADKRGAILGISIERGVCLGVVALLLLLGIVLFALFVKSSQKIKPKK